MCCKATDPDDVPVGEDLWEAIPRAVFARLGVNIDDVRFGGAYYFHGTRTLGPRAFFRDGIRPLGDVLDQLWNDLYGLCDGEVSHAQWQALRRELEGPAHSSLHDEDSAWLYHFKFDDPAHYGPYASLIREHAP
jgi:hypothetical protein